MAEDTTPAAEDKRRIDALFDRYGESHRHGINKAIHWICVPLITWSLLGMLWAASPLWAYLLIAAATVFYVWLSMTIAVGMLALSALMIYPLLLLGPNALVASVVVFVLAWVGQFIGHRIEGAKPSFFEDLRFLLVGPAWLLAFVYRRLGIPY